MPPFFIRKVFPLMKIRGVILFPFVFLTQTSLINSRFEMSTVFSTSFGVYEVESNFGLQR